MYWSRPRRRSGIGNRESGIDGTGNWCTSSVASRPSPVARPPSPFTVPDTPFTPRGTTIECPNPSDGGLGVTNPFSNPEQVLCGPAIRRSHRVMIGLGLTAFVAAAAAVHTQGEADRERVAPVLGAAVPARPSIGTDTAQRTWLEM